ncbi:DUF2567 domain-containing protein [Nakamurella silvestris]|nr:DUF2567 domain-containing protein [Nakamurella silvestris]
MSSPAQAVTPHRAVAAWLRTRQARTVAVVVAVGWVLGVAQAFAWSRLAPGIENKVLANGNWGQMPTASAHAFTSVAIFSLLGLGIGIIGAMVVWQIRSLRGPIGLAALLVGALGGGAIAFVLAPHLVSGVDPATVGPTGSEIMVIAAPVLTVGTMTTLGKALFFAALIVVTAAAASFVYTFAAFLSDRGDLGRSGGARDRHPVAATAVPFGAVGVAAPAGPVPNGTVPNGTAPEPITRPVHIPPQYPQG